MFDSQNQRGEKEEFSVFPTPESTLRSFENEDDMFLAHRRVQEEEEPREIVIFVCQHVIDSISLLLSRFPVVITSKRRKRRSLHAFLKGRRGRTLNRTEQRTHNEDVNEER